MKVIYRTITALDSNETPINKFLDLPKAFDTLDHNISLNKLHMYGICNIALELMESYLKNRKQYLTYTYSISETLPITTGVPQCSIIGPLLFAIFIYVMYTDDTLFTTIQSLNSCTKDIKQLNRKLNKVNEWLSINKLSLNIKKSKYIIHKLRNNFFLLISNAR